MSRGLGWLGRNAAALLATGIFVGLALPPLAALLRPLLVPAMLFILTLAMVRVDWSQVIDHSRRTGSIAAVLVWLLVVSPILTWWVATAIGLPYPLIVALTLMATAPAITGAAAFALILGLDAPLALVITTISTIITPFTLPPMALLLLDLDLDIGLAEFFLRLAAFIGGSLVAALILRRLLTADRIATHAPAIDGITVLALLVFAVGIMDGVTALLIENTSYVLLCVAAAFVANLALQAVGGLAFAGFGRHRALTLGFASGNRNMGVVLAVLADKASFEIIVFFAVAQLPMYVLPVLIRPLYRRLLTRS